MSKIDKMTPKELNWFDMYIELKLELTSRIFDLEERVRSLERNQPIGRIGI